MPSSRDEEAVDIDRHTWQFFFSVKNPAHVYQSLRVASSISVSIYRTTQYP